ncbi:Hypothetical protein SMAX5B_021757%2C partial [Scomber scombrus]|uniref:Uncharacterized protein n=1 Tax=Scomber scombrus TaxID=13677 RepID=A0AAV1QLT8_SCOSC
MTKRSIDADDAVGGANAVCDSSSKEAATFRWKMELAKRSTQTMVVSETPVTCYRDVWGAPKKRVTHLCRVQLPPSELLHREWRLEDGGSWGYVFNYSGHEMCIYQLEKGEYFSPLGLKANLTSTDWSVLCTLSTYGSRENDPLVDPDEPMSEDGEKNWKLVSSMVWETKRTGSGRWYYRASHQTKETDTGVVSEFVLDYFNGECGVLQSTLRLPLDHWAHVMSDLAEKVKGLFVSSQSYKDIMMVRRTL